MENGLITCLWMLGGVSILSLLFQLIMVYSFVWGKNYQMRYKGKDGKEIIISGDVEKLRQEIKKELKEDFKEIIKEFKDTKNNK